ncbi:transcription factor IIIA [Anoplophora glabripennis]|uniref:transcription factor IIIA n=1 Tax=Anoplophora glabripennis TaxID=217634 RepID=UPI0008736416|nr:transcription factor IIIA [Anoplophora glabripennis]
MKMDSCENNIYKCPENGCNAKYTKLSRLEIHKRKHTGERPFFCDVENCERAYTNIAHLKRHKSFVHDKSSEVMCTVSGCGLVFNNKYSLKKHTNQHHNISNSLFKCALCLQEFKKKRQLKNHLYLHTGGEEPLKCSICNITFETVHLYNKHKSNHKTYTCDCGSVFNRWTLFCQHRKKSCSIKKIDHKCVICNKVFTTKSNLKFHSMSHIEESQRNSYRCPYLDCNRSYKYKKNLKSHISVYHEKKNDEPRIKCTEEGCDVVFKSKKYLRRHILNIHNRSTKKKDRKPRKDKGKKKKCMASILSGVPLPMKEHSAILNKSNLTSDSHNNHEKIPTNDVSDGNCRRI